MGLVTERRAITIRTKSMLVGNIGVAKLQYVGFLEKQNELGISNIALSIKCLT